MRGTLVCLLALLVTGCVSNPPIPEESWRLTGKLALQTSSDSQILGIDWYQTGAKGDISLKGPFGVRVARITTQGGELTIDTGQDVLTYREGDMMVAEGVGALKLPWQSLAGWVRGDFGDKFIDGDWQFEITHHMPDGPGTILLQHPDFKLRLKVKRWEIAI